MGGQQAAAAASEAPPLLPSPAVLPSEPASSPAPPAVDPGAAMGEPDPAAAAVAAAPGSSADAPPALGGKRRAAVPAGGPSAEDGAPAPAAPRRKKRKTPSQQQLQLARPLSTGGDAGAPPAAGDPPGAAAAAAAPPSSPTTETVRAGPLWNGWSTLSELLQGPHPPALGGQGDPGTLRKALQPLASPAPFRASSARRLGGGDGAEEEGALVPLPLLCNPGVTAWTRLRLRRLPLPASAGAAPPAPPALALAEEVRRLLRPLAPSEEPQSRGGDPGPQSCSGGATGTPDLAPPPVCMARHLLASLRGSLRGPEGAKGEGSGEEEEEEEAVPPPTFGSPPGWWASEADPAGPQGAPTGSACARHGCGRPALRRSRYCGAECGLHTARLRLAAALGALLGEGGQEPRGPGAEGGAQA